MTMYKVEFSMQHVVVTIIAYKYQQKCITSYDVHFMYLFTYIHVSYGCSSTTRIITDLLIDAPILFKEVDIHYFIAECVMHSFMDR